MDVIRRLELQPDIMYTKVGEEQYAAELASTDRFIAFSAEVLRLALLGVAAVGFLLKGKLLAAPDGVVTAMTVLTLACFALATACALAHRFLVTHALMYYFFGLRKHNVGNDARKLLEKRGRHLRLGPPLKAASALLLGAGALILATVLVLSLGTSERQDPLSIPKSSLQGAESRVGK